MRHAGARDETPATTLPPSEPPADCPLCPRLAAYREVQRAAHPGWFNAPVPPFGDDNAWLAIIGLAPGLKGANRTGRAFTGDGSGAMLFTVLAEHGLASGVYHPEGDDMLRLEGAVIINAVRCVPPENRPFPAEIRACRPYLAAPLDARPSLRAIVALGRIAHDAVIATFAQRPATHRFAHGAEHRLTEGIFLIDSYHCSRYNQNIGRITHNMLWSAFDQAMSHRPEGSRSGL